MSDLLYVHHPAERRTAAEWRQFERWAERCDYTRIITLPDNGRADLLFPVPGLVISPGVVVAPSPQEIIP